MEGGRDRWREGGREGEVEEHFWGDRVVWLPAPLAGHDEEGRRTGGREGGRMEGREGGSEDGHMPFRK